MPLYSDLSLYGSPSTSYSSLYLSGPYSNHSSFLSPGSSNYRSPIYVKALPRTFARGYTPHLSTISESQGIAPLRRKYSPKLMLQHHASPKFKVPKPIKINTADIDVSVNKYRKYDRKNAEIKKAVPEKAKSPSPKIEVKEESKEVSDNKPIRRDRALVRLHTIHKKDSPRKNVSPSADTPKSWRQNFYADELKPEDRPPKKTPGELLVDKFLIRTKDDALNKLNRRPTIRRPSKNQFHEICRVISSDTINEDLNPGQPPEIIRRQSKQFGNDELIISNESVLDDIIKEQQQDENNNTSTPERKGSLKRKKRITKKKTSELVLEPEPKSSLQRRPQKKIRRTSTDSSLLSDVMDEDAEKAYQEAIRDISQVEVEEIRAKPRPIFTATVDVEQTSKLKAVIDDVEIVESPNSLKKPPKKFKYNVVVEEVEEEEQPMKSKLIKEKKTNGTVQNPSPKEVLNNKIPLQLNEAHLAQIIEDKVKSPKLVKQKAVVEAKDEVLPKSSSANSLGDGSLLNHVGDKPVPRKSILKTSRTASGSLFGAPKTPDEVRKVIRIDENANSDLKSDKPKKVQVGASEELQKIPKFKAKPLEEVGKLGKVDDEKVTKFKLGSPKPSEDVSKVGNESPTTPKFKLGSPKPSEDVAKLNKVDDKVKEELAKIPKFKAKPLEDIGKLSKVDDKVSEEKTPTLKLGSSVTKPMEDALKLNKLEEIVVNESSKIPTTPKLKLGSPVPKPLEDVTKSADEKIVNESPKTPTTPKFKLGSPASKPSEDVAKSSKVEEGIAKIPKFKPKPLEDIANGKKVEVKVTNDSPTTPKLKLGSPAPTSKEECANVSKLDEKATKSTAVVTNKVNESDSTKSRELSKTPSAERLAPKLAPKEENKSGENFWETIGTRESVYLDRRRRNLQEQRKGSRIQEEEEDSEERKQLEVKPAFLKSKSEEAPKIKFGDDKMKAKSEEKSNPTKKDVKSDDGKLKKEEVLLKNPKVVVDNPGHGKKDEGDILKNEDKLKKSTKLESAEEVGNPGEDKLGDSKKNKSDIPKEEVKLKNVGIKLKKVDNPVDDVKLGDSKKNKSDVSKVETKLKNVGIKTKKLESEEKGSSFEDIKLGDSKKDDSKLESKLKDVAAKTKNPVEDAKLGDSKKDEGKLKKVKKIESDDIKVGDDNPNESKAKKVEGEDKVVPDEGKPKNLKVGRLRKEKSEETATKLKEPKELKKAKSEEAAVEKTEGDDATKEDEESEAAKAKKLMSKRSLVNKSGIQDPDLEVFVVPKEPTPPPPKEPSPPKFVPLQSNRLSAWMHPFKKPEQFDECPVQIFARPKTIRHRHYPRPRGPSAMLTQEEAKAEAAKSSEGKVVEEEEDDDDEEEETTSEEEETDDDEEDGDDDEDDDDDDEDSEESIDYEELNDVWGYRKVGASTSSDDSGFHSSSLGNRKNKGFQKSGRITPPATTIPRFRKYNVEDFTFLKVLGKGSFGKVLLAELKDTEYYYAIKCLKKDVVLEDDDVECTLIERKVLALGTKHPYLCHLLCTFQTESHLFFVMEYLNGGDLMFHIQQSGRFLEPRARFYAAEIVSGLKFLHSKGIVYRDLKLDNILLDFDGHVRIADFGMCKLQIFLDRTADTFCGTPDYMAPEIIKGQHYNQNVDWWSFGVLLYEMLIGQSPFSGCDEDELFWSICNERPVLPRFLSREANNILTLLLEKDATKRLGNKFCLQGDIQDQPFFHPVDWELLNLRQLEPPFRPNLQHPLDTQYFDRTFTAEKAKLTPINQTILQSMDQTQFQGFSYTNPNATDR